MKRLTAILVSAGAGITLLAAGTAAGAAITGGPIDSSGVIHGCWTTAAVKGSHRFALQDAGTGCPKGKTPIGWNQQGPAGPQGPAGTQGTAGPQGPAGPPGTSGVSSVTDFNGITCTTDGGADGTVTTSTASGDTVTLTCQPLPTDPDCTHANGVGQNYTDCNDLFGDPSTGAGYNQAMADLAASAFMSTLNPRAQTVVMNDTDTCGDKVAVVAAPGQSAEELYVWDYGPVSNSTPNGTVHAGGVYIEPTSVLVGKDLIACLDPSGAATWT